MNVARSEILSGLEPERNPAPKDPVTSLEESDIEMPGTPLERFISERESPNPSE